ncbi:hypothetical protein K438DRAFT_1611782 [Mycena galopus ATCC 62051]|nr:hypothetical protein K438DRAFT_1611782 [Mycena galopus ATCC 62051]
MFTWLDWFQVLEVRTFDASTPIFIVQYQHYERKGVSPGWAQCMVGATLQEQNLLVRLLRRNSKRILSSYCRDRLETGNGFELSFLLPIGPLTMKDRGKHSTIEGCPNCGETAVDLKKCARCLGVSYCSRKCQKGHWKTHRHLCNSVFSGKWQNVTARRPRMYHLNPSAIIGHPETVHFPGHGKLTPPNNIHGTDPFIAKLEFTLDCMEEAKAEGRVGIFLYDRQQSFEFVIDRESEGFGMVSVVVMQKSARMRGGPTIYCWAKRTGDWTMSLCLDPLPEQPKW